MRIVSGNNNKIVLIMLCLFAKKNAYVRFIREAAKKEVNFLVARPLKGEGGG